MAYIPPHKRHTDGPSLASSQPPNQRNPKGKLKSGGKILYSKESISRWFIISSEDDDAQPPCPIRLKGIPIESMERKDGHKPMILVSDHRQRKEVKESDKSPWVSIVDKVREDLLTSFQNARIDMCSDGAELNVPRFVIRFGKILFLGDHSSSLDNADKLSAAETILSRLKRRYYTNVPNSFVEVIQHEFVPKVGLDFFEEKEHYYVKVFDKSRPHSTISCKCTLVSGGGELHPHKMELNEVRQLIVDISCLDKSLDLRLLLSSKRILTSLTDDEKHSLTSLIKVAVIDSEVKGGLRWPLGKESLGDRYTVVGVWHTKAKTFKNSSMRLKLRHADRFDFRTSSGEVAQEASLRIPELTRQLRDGTLELNPLPDMVTETLKLVWDHFLCWEGSFA